jgi:hypothetical protein
MGLRFYRRVRILPGVHVNVSRSGPSLTVGVRGAHTHALPAAVDASSAAPPAALVVARRFAHGGHRASHVAALGSC